MMARKYRVIVYIQSSETFATAWHGGPYKYPPPIEPRCRSFISYRVSTPSFSFLGVFYVVHFFFGFVLWNTLYFLIVLFV